MLAEFKAVDFPVEEYQAALGNLAGKYRYCSVLPSELLMFYRYAKQAASAVIVESGSYRGFTALRLSRLFPRRAITTYEIKKDMYLDTRRALNGVSNVQAIHGPVTGVPAGACVLIDGPKNAAAVALAHRLLETAAWVAIHDVAPFITQLPEQFDLFDYSSRTDYVQFTSHLDAPAWQVLGARNGDRPFRFFGGEQQLYAYTLAFVRKQAAG